MKEKIKYERSYLGTTITAANYRQILNEGGRSAINYHNKHLRAYLKGKKTFTHGFEKDENGKTKKDNWGRPIPTVYRVQAVLKPLGTKDMGGALPTGPRAEGFTTSLRKGPNQAPETGS